MRRRSKAGGKSAKAQSRNTAAHRGRIAPKAVPILPGPAAPQDTLRLVLETALDAVVVKKSDGVVADWSWASGSAIIAALSEWQFGCTFASAIT